MGRSIRTLVPPGFLGLAVSELALIAYAYTLASFATLSVSPEVFLLETGGWQALIWVLGAVALSLHLQGLYSDLRSRSGITILQQLCAGFGFALLVESGITYLRPGLRVPVRVMVGGSLLAMLLVVLWRQLYGSYVLSVVGRQRVLFVGANVLVGEIAARIEEHEELGLTVAGYVAELSQPTGAAAVGKNLGPIEKLPEIARAAHADRIVVGMAERRQRMPVEDLLKLRFAGFMIEEASTTFEMLCGRVSTRGLQPAQLILSSEFTPSVENVRYQAWFSFAVALAALVLTSPFVLLGMLALRLRAPGPTILREECLGRGGLVFRRYRFRRGSLSGGKLTGMDWVLWRTGLAHIPGLLNVLRGEMSLVGPRAESPEQGGIHRESIPYYRHRHSVKPGLTGWAQMHEFNLPEPLDPVQRLEYDLYYIKHMAFDLDVYILLQTLKHVLEGKVS